MQLDLLAYSSGELRSAAWKVAESFDHHQGRVWVSGFKPTPRSELRKVRQGFIYLYKNTSTRLVMIILGGPVAYTHGKKKRAPLMESGWGGGASAHPNIHPYRFSPSLTHHCYSTQEDSYHTPPLFSGSWLFSSLKVFSSLSPIVLEYISPEMSFLNKRWVVVSLQQS